MKSTRTELSRRDFLKTTAVAGAGLTLSFTIPGAGAREASAAAAFEPNATLTITPDGIITVHITKAEMGQGVGTALAQIVAEELEADWKDVRIDYPMNDPKYGLMLTGGSWSVNWTFDSLSRAGAGARMLLTEAAAKQMNVAVADCVAEDGRIRHLPTGRSMPYGEIVAKVPITRTLSEEDLKKIELKKPSQYRIIGKWIPRLDIPEKVTGKAKFGIDTFLPGMVYAKVAYPPTREGGKHTAVDDTGARRVKGWIQTVVTDDVVAVVADTYDNAVRARDALRVSWDPGPNAGVSTASIFEMYAKKAKEDLTAPSWVEQGDVKAGLAQAAKTHEATFTTDYVAHMQMEPMNCVVRLDGGAYDIYTGSQFQTMAVGALSKKLGVDPSKIRIHQHYLGGGFGRRLEPDIMLETALIAREVKRPVKLIRSREEDLRRDYYRSATLQVLRGGLSADRKAIAWENTLVAAYPGERYGGLRGQGGEQLAPNVGRGVACVTAQERKSPTWTASVVEAQVDPASGAVKVRKIVCAVDCGIVVNPDGARSQIEGSLLFGLSNALKERGTVKNGALEQSNFHDYQVLRMSDVPEVEVHVVPSTEYPTGLGEPGTTTILPALSNAIFAATGARVRSAPLTAERVLKAIQQKA